MKKLITTLFVVFMLIACAQAHAEVTVTTTGDGTTLTNNILGSGITASNISYTGSATSSGTFTGGLGSGIGMDTGIILTSGNASFADGTNSSDATSQSTGLAGDSDLNGLVSGFTTLDATILEFDFESTAGDLYFNYVFASEEYNEWVNSSYNDVFGFFLDNVNIALIPGTSTPVAINNVNNGSNSAYYNDNDLGDFGGTPPYNFEYDGFTDVFTAQALGLSAGTHHIKLAIADAGDRALDSAVFIQGGSFSDTPTTGNPVPEPASMLLLGSGLAGAAFTRRRKKA